MSFSEDFDPMTGGSAPVDRETEVGSRTWHTPRIHIPSPVVGSTTPKTLFVIVVYMFMLGLVTMAFQSSYVAGLPIEFEDTYESFNPNKILEGEYGYSSERGIMLESYFGKEYDPEKYSWQQWETIELDKNKFIDLDDEYAISRIEEAWLSRSQAGWKWPFSNEVATEENAYNVNDGSDHPYGLGNAIESVQSFFGSIIDAFGFIISILTFNFYPAVPLPAILAWIPFFMVLPVWIYIALLLAPFAIAAINAIGNLIPFT